MINTDISGKWIAKHEYLTEREKETKVVLGMAETIDNLKRDLMSAKERILELEQQLYGSK